MTDHIRIVTSAPGKSQTRWDAEESVRDWPTFKLWLRSGPTTGGKYDRPYTPVTLDENPCRRQNVHLVERHALTLDADKAGPDYIDWLREVMPWAWLSHTTASHEPDDPHWRTVLPTSRAMKPGEAKTIATHLLGLVGVERFDAQPSTSPIQVAYAPAWPGVEYVDHDGPVLDVDEVLSIAEPVDWSAGDPGGGQTVAEFLDAHPIPASGVLPNCAYGRGTLAKVIEELEKHPEGSGVVHKNIYHAAARSVEMIEAGCWSVEDLDTLEDVAKSLRDGKRPNEWSEALASALERGVGGEAGCSEHAAVEPSTAERLPPEFWAARPGLRQVHAWAKARKASPEATLLYVLVRIVAATPPNVVLPPLIGGEMSLNLFATIVSPSGRGKGAASRASDAALYTSLPYKTAQVGSGEGIGHLFMRKATKADRTKGLVNADGVVQHSTAVLFDVPEIDTVAALNGRQASTLMPELRKAWMGERLGFAYANPDKALPIGEHLYRLCLVIGMQPGKGGALMGEAERVGGTTQRFLFGPGSDPNVVRGRTTDPEERIVYAPPTEFAVPDGAGLIVMKVCDEAADAIIETHADNMAGKVGALDGHAMACREKVAAALALWDGRLDIRSEDWALAGQVMAMSHATRSAVERAEEHAGATGNARRGQAAGYAEVAKTEVIDRAFTEKAGQAIMRAVKKAGIDGVAWNDVKKSMRAPYRPYAEDALEALRAAGQIRIESAKQGQTGRRLYLP